MKNDWKTLTRPPLRWGEVGIRHGHRINGAAEFNLHATTGVEHVALMTCRRCHCEYLAPVTTHEILTTVSRLDYCAHCYDFVRRKLIALGLSL